MNILGIGADIEETARIAALKPAALKRVFTEAELAYCLPLKNAAQSLAARFAAKEAVIKALPFDGIALKKIEIIKDKSGKPQIKLHDKRGKDIKFKVSLSHAAAYATAFGVAYKENAKDK